MAEPVAITKSGHRCRLKWHRARRHRDDTVFTAARIRQGLGAGAAVEVDINPISDGSWAVLHGPTLGLETTGSGPVAALTGAELRALRLRDNAGHPTGHPVASLAALAADLSDVAAPAGGHLQLDLKVGSDALTPANMAQFAQDMAPIAHSVLLSGGDAAAVRRLADAADITVGFDPCHEADMLDLAVSGAFDSFVARALAAVPEARILYLARALVIAADARGADLIGAIRAAGREVDVYTYPDASATTLDELDRILALRADQITTDDPAALAAAFEPA